MAGTTLRCIDNLNDPDFVQELRGVFYFTADGNIYRVRDSTLVEGSKLNRRYWAIHYNGRYYMKHRVIYALKNGPFYSHIDHIDRDTNNNSPSNLRLCTQGLNVANARMRSDNTTGFMGVIWHKSSRKWQAQTMFNGKRVHIGLYTDKKEAALAYNHKLEELFGPKCTFNKVF
jgi:hypothetical protein